MTNETDILSINELLEQLGREPISITEIMVTPITYKPADGSYIHECGPVVLTKRDAAVIQVFTDQGIIGIGPGEPRDAERDYSHLVGQNPFDIPTMSVGGGIDVACWDIIGRAKGQPVYQILAGDHEPNPEVHVYASGGVMWTYYDRGDGQAYGVEALIEEALSYKALGFDTFKWRPGTDWDEASVNPTKLGEICQQLREAVGPDFDLGLEKKGYDSWTFDECIEIAPIINELNFLFFEQPMGDQGPAQFADYQTIKDQMPNVMLWGGESLRSVAKAEPWITQEIYDAIQTDCHYIGLTEEWRIAQLANQHGIKIVPHNWSTSLGTMCNSHIVAAVASGHMCEFFMYPNGFREGLLKEPYVPKNGIITLSDKPGFGMELVDDFTQRFPYQPGPNTIANPRFPHAWPRVREREEAVSAKYRS
ncbi:MAG: mandelate racemase/muconate lactonizing enzyme family protein [Chloroflexota bacterium]